MDRSRSLLWVVRPPEVPLHGIISNYRATATALLGLYLRPVHDATGGRIEGVAAMHRAPVVPEHQVPDLPLMTPGEGLTRRLGPDVIEQRVGFLEREPLEVGV